MKKSIWISISIITILIISYVIYDKYFSQQQRSTQRTMSDILLLKQTQITSFDPLDAYHIGHVQMVKQLYNTLTDIDETGHTIPSIAESWSTTDGKDWTINLRSGVKFSDDNCFANNKGRELIADDVKYSFERLLDSTSKSLGKAYFNNIIGVSEFQKGLMPSISGIKVISDSSIKFFLLSADFSFFKLLSLVYTSIVPSEAIKRYKDKFNLHPVGTGPFNLQSYVTDKSVKFVKNPSYWEKLGDQQLPFIDTLNIELLTDENFALSQFKSGKSDFLELSLSQYYQIKDEKNPSFKLQSIPTATLQFYIFNLDKVKDPAYRHAVSYSIDRKQIQNLISDFGTIATSIFPFSIFPDVSIKQPLLLTDLNKSKKGIENGPKELKLVCFDDVLSRNISQSIQNSLRELNVKVNIEAVPFSVLVEKLIRGDYDLLQIYWGPFYADEAHYLMPFLTKSFPPAGNNFNRYSNSKFDELVNFSLKTDEAKNNFMQAEKLILNDMPFLILYFSNSIRISDGKFKMPLHPLQYRFYKLARPNN